MRLVFDAEVYLVYCFKMISKANILLMRIQNRPLRLTTQVGSPTHRKFQQMAFLKLEHFGTVMLNAS